MMPTFTAQPIEFVAPEGFHALSPSIACIGEQTVLVIGTTNYKARKNEDKNSVEGSHSVARKFLLRLNTEFDVLQCEEILPPTNHAQSLAFWGIEEPRLFLWRGALWFSSPIRQQPISATRPCGQVLARIEHGPERGYRVAELRLLPPEDRGQGVQSWVPQVAGDRLRFIRGCDPISVADEQAKVILDATPPIALDHLCGGSQAIAFDGGWLALMREATERHEKRYHFHRFVWFDNTTLLKRVMSPFFLHNGGIEAPAGLAWHNDIRCIIVSYHAGEGEAWIATVNSEDVRCILDDVDRLPTSMPGDDYQALHHVVPLEISRPVLTPSIDLQWSRQKRPELCRILGDEPRIFILARFLARCTSPPLRESHPL
jgi:hypothetical protein